MHALDLLRPVTLSAMTALAACGGLATENGQPDIDASLDGRASSPPALPSVDAAPDGVALEDAAERDAENDRAVDTGPREAAPNCSCLSGTYRVAGAPREYQLELRNCDGLFTCTLDTASRNCMATADRAFRVNVDTLGYVQLIFNTPLSCVDPWTGVYASEGGGSYKIEATRVP